MIINNLHSNQAEKLGFRLGLSSFIPHSSLVRAGWAYIFDFQRCEVVKTARAVDRLGQNFAANLLSLPLAKPIQNIELTIRLSSFFLQNNLFFRRK
jgi:hypothetical protein